jgi:hypothetical protein
VDLVAIIRVLWRRRILVCLGLLPAIGLGLLAAQGESNTVGIASTRLVFDTRPSQFVAPSPAGADSLTWRAALLSNKLATAPVRRALAEDLRVPVRRLAVVEASLKTPTVRTTIAPRALKAGDSPTADFVLTVRYDAELPIVSTEAHAPTAAQARTLVEASVDALARVAMPARRTVQTQPYAMERVANTRVREVVNGPGRVMPAVFSLLVFGSWCACLVLLEGLLRRRPGAGRVVPA